MKKVKYLGMSALIGIGLSLGLNGCAVKTGNAKLENVETKDMSTMITRGATTEAGIRSMFGEPQDMDFMQDGRKKWKYTFVHKQEKGINYVPVANWFVNGTNDKTKTLLVMFKNGVVDDYIFSTATGETMAGAIK